MTNVDSVFKSRDITLLTKVCLVKAMIFPVVMYRREIWTIKKAECQRSDAFKLWCWRRLLRLPWTASRSNQSNLKEISPEYSLEGLMLKLKTLATWCEELTHWKRPWCWERLKAKEKGAAENEMVRKHCQLNVHDLSKLGEIVEDKGAWHATIHGVTESGMTKSTKQPTLWSKSCFSPFYRINNPVVITW